MSAFAEFTSVNLPVKEGQAVGEYILTGWDAVILNTIDCFDEEISTNFNEVASELFEQTQDSDIKARYAVYNEGVLINLVVLYEDDEVGRCDCEGGDCS